MPTITIHDQTTSGTTSELTLDLLTETLTVRELLRSRVYQEVHDFNRKQLANPNTPYHGLVTPTDAETTLNGPKSNTAQLISHFLTPLVMIQQHPRQLVEARKSNGVCDV